MNRFRQKKLTGLPMQEDRLLGETVGLTWDGCSWIPFMEVNTAPCHYLQCHKVRGMHRAKSDSVLPGPTDPTTKCYWDSVHALHTKLASPHINSGARLEKLHCTAALCKIPLRGFPKVTGPVQARTKRVVWEKKNLYMEAADFSSL